MARRTEDRVPVEPLSDARWARIERSLFERMETELPLAEAVRSSRGRGRGRMTGRMGAALVLAGGAVATIGAVASGLAWHAPAAVASHVTTAGSGSHVSVGGAGLDVAPRSEVLVSGDDEHGVVVTLAHGSVECEVAPRHGRPPFVVQAGDVSVRVVGTRFVVSRDGNAVKVDVTKGIVEVDSRGDTDRVGAGEHWPPGSSPAEAAPAASTPSSSGPATSVPSVAAPVASAARVATAPAARALPGNAGSAPPSGRASPTVPPAPAPANDAPAAPPAVVDATSASAQARYEAAARLESSDPAGALDAYRSLARGSGPWAANALFAAGRLAADRRATREARALLDQYLARFPHGPNAADARDLRDRMGAPGP